MTLGRWHRNTKRPEDTQRQYDLAMDGKHTVHPSETLFTNLLHIYYFSAKIALANRQMLMSLDTEAVKPQDVLGCRQEVQEATTAIGNCLKTLTEQQLARFLPVSVVLCIALPYALQTVGYEKQHEQVNSSAQVFTHAMETYDPLYEGVEGLTKTIQFIIGENSLVELMGADPQMIAIPASDRVESMAFPPACYMRLVLTMDIRLSTGRLPEEQDLPSTLREHSANDAGCPGTVITTPRALPHMDGATVFEADLETFGRHGDMVNTEFGLQTDLTQLPGDLQAFEGDIAEDDFMAFDKALAVGDEAEMDTSLWEFTKTFPDLRGQGCPSPEQFFFNNLGN